MKIRTYPNDQVILAVILVLSGFGIVMMYSASSIYAMNQFDNYLHFFLQLSPAMKSRVKSIVAYGEAGNKIKKQLKTEFQMDYHEKFDKAVLQAHEQSEPGDTILLSPACASFDQFSNYEERGDEFNLIFNKLELML